MSRLVISLAILLAIPTAVFAIDPAKIDRKIVKEPVYQTKSPQYGLLVFGAEAKDQVWLVWDGDRLFVDRNGNGDLTEPQKMIVAKKSERPAEFPKEYRFDVGEISVGGRTHKGLSVSAAQLTAYSNPAIQQRPDVKAALAKDPRTMVFTLVIDAEVPGMKGGGLGGRLNYLVGPLDLNGVLLFGDKPIDAPIIHLGGPLEVTFYDHPTLRAGRSTEFDLVVGTPGVGTGTFAMLGYTNTIPKDAKAVIEATYRSNVSGNPPLKEKHILNERCCTVNLYDTLRIPENADPTTGTFHVTLDGWKEGNVAPTTHDLPILPKIGAKAEDVSASLVAILSNPRTLAERNANVWSIKFSGDGKRLYSSSYPSGLIQVWDVAGKRELRRIESPPGLRGSAEYALYSPDDKTVYVPVEVRKVTAYEKDGKKGHRLEYSGLIRVWDLNTGEEKPSLTPPENHSANFTRLSPDGRLLVCLERISHEATENQKSATVVWDLTTGKREVIADRMCAPVFAPDGKTLALQGYDAATKTSNIRLLEIGTYKELANLECPEKERYFSPHGFSPDGSLIAVALGGKKGAPCEVWFLDGKTLEDRGRFVVESDPNWYGWASAEFTPDSKRYILFNGNDTVVVWDLAGKKIVQKHEIAANGWRITMSPNGKSIAMAWAPKPDPQLEQTRNADPRDLPQPRVTLYDITTDSPPRTMIAPHGFLGGLAYSPDGKTLAFGTTGGVRLFDISK